MNNLKKCFRFSLLSTLREFTLPFFLHRLITSKSPLQQGQLAGRCWQTSSRQDCHTRPPDLLQPQQPQGASFTRHAFPRHHTEPVLPSSEVAWEGASSPPQSVCEVLLHNLSEKGTTRQKQTKRVSTSKRATQVIQMCCQMNYARQDWVHGVILQY